MERLLDIAAAWVTTALLSLPSVANPGAPQFTLADAAGILFLVLFAGLCLIGLGVLLISLIWLALSVLKPFYEPAGADPSPPR